MKTKILISSLLFFLVISATAQSNGDFYKSESKSNNDSFLKYGLKVGYDMHPITFNPEEITDQLQNGYQGGIFLQLGRSVYLQPEIYYATYVNPVNSVSSEKIQSIRAPILLGVRLINLGIVSAHVMGGPVYTASLSELTTGIRIKDLTHKWQVGVGVDVLGFITADVRYTLLDGIDISDQFSNFSKETSMLNVTVGFKLK